MIPYERQQRILELLSERPLIRLERLLRELPDVSESTLRRDIKQLEANHMVEHLAGGGIKLYSPTHEVPTYKKRKTHVMEKQGIAQIAARMIQPEDTIYVDSGSTCTELLSLILGMPIIIVTTNTDVITLVKEDSKATVLLTGGVVNPAITSLSGSITNEIINRYNFDLAFIGANGIDLKRGITTPRIEESQKKRLVAERSQRLYVLADSSKFHMVSNVHVLDFEGLSIISDSPDEDLEQVVEIIYE